MHKRAPDFCIFASGEGVLGILTNKNQTYCVSLIFGINMLLFLLKLSVKNRHFDDVLAVYP